MKQQVNRSVYVQIHTNKYIYIYTCVYMYDSDAKVDSTSARLNKISRPLDHAGTLLQAKGIPGEEPELYCPP